MGSLTYYSSSLADLREQAFRLHAAELSVRYAAAFDGVGSREDLVEAPTDLIERQARAAARDMSRRRARTRVGTA